MSQKVSSQSTPTGINQGKNKDFWIYWHGKGKKSGKMIFLAQGNKKGNENQKSGNWN